MPHDLRFFTMILPNQPWPELLRRYRHLEELGFDIAAFADHFADWTGGKGIWFECFTLLTAVASRTSRIRLGAYVAQIPLRNPALLAHQALTIDHVSNGRLELGLGLGLPTDPSYAMMGLPNWSNRERVARFPEYVHLVDQLLREDISRHPLPGRWRGDPASADTEAAAADRYRGNGACNVAACGTVCGHVEQ